MISTRALFDVAKRPVAVDEHAQSSDASQAWLSLVTAACGSTTGLHASSQGLADGPASPGPALAGRECVQLLRLWVDAPVRSSTCTGSAASRRRSPVRCWPRSGHGHPRNTSLGTLLDHLPPKPILIAANLASALGYTGFAFVDLPGQASRARSSAVPGRRRPHREQDVLITLIRPEQRVASFALGRAAQNLGLGIGATVAKFIVSSAQDLRSFKTLYLFDAMTTSRSRSSYWQWCRIDAPRRERAPGDEDSGRSPATRFLIVIAVNIVLIIVGYTLFANNLAPFVEAHTRVGPGAIGILFVFNTFFVAIAQVPATRLVKGMRRARNSRPRAGSLRLRSSASCRRPDRLRARGHRAPLPASQRCSRSASASTPSSSAHSSPTSLLRISSGATSRCSA